MSSTIETEARCLIVHPEGILYNLKNGEAWLTDEPCGLDRAALLVTSLIRGYPLHISQTEGKREAFGTERRITFDAIRSEKPRGTFYDRMGKPLPVPQEVTIPLPKPYSFTVRCIYEREFIGGRPIHTHLYPQVFTEGWKPAELVAYFRSQVETMKPVVLR